MRLATLEKGVKDEAGISPDRIMQLGYAFRGAKVLLSAVELDLFTALASDPCDGETLRRRLGLHERGARDFFDALVALGLLTRRNGVYANMPETDFYLDRKKPTYIGGIFHLANTRLYPVWGLLSDALRTGEAQEWASDADIFDGQYSDESSVAEFAQAMTGLSLPIGHALARLFPWTDYRTFIDIGAAEGALAVEIVRAHPHLAAGGFDLPQVRPAFEAYVKRQGLLRRLRFHAGDFLKQELPSADVLVMGQILHDWNLDVKQMLLKKAHTALPEGGALIVYDQMIDDDRRENAAGLLMSLSMLIRTRGGFDYTGADCISWLREAGFRRLQRQHLCGPYTMIVAAK